MSEIMRSAPSLRPLGTVVLLMTLTCGKVHAVCVSDSPNPGCIHFLMRTSSAFDAYDKTTNTAQQEWFQTHFWEMQLSSPFFDSRLKWYPRAITYYDLYGIHTTDPLVGQHPEWILKDKDGNLLYINYNCTGSGCSQYAFDFSNPAFQQRQISVLAKMLSAGYRGFWLDNVDLQVETSNGQGQTVYPLDPNTGQVMTIGSWEKYMANFTMQVRQAFPKAQIVHNSIWYAGTQPAGSDPYVQQEIQAADWINLERGVSDPNLTVGTGKYSLNAMLNFVDVVHSLGRYVSVQEYNFNGDYGLAGYYLISSGLDALGNDAITPFNWWNGYDYDLGAPLGPRYNWLGVYRRDFSNGLVLLNPFGGSNTTLNPPGSFVGTDGSAVSSVTLAGGQAAVLINAGSPNIQVLGVANAASYATGAFSPGEIVAIFGQEIGPPVLITGEVNYNGPLSSISGGSQVFFDGIPAPLVYVSSTQLSVIVPYEVAGQQKTDLVITYNGATSNPFALAIAPTAPGLFAANEQGSGQGLILNQDGTLNSSATPAPPGSTIVMFGTGEGMLSPAGSTGEIVDISAPFPAIASPVSVTIGDAPCKIVYAGSVPTFVEGLFQINAVVPGGVASGYQPIHVHIGGVASQDNLIVVVQ
jgi:uncharacterized protein (TIGR03437 family)